MQPGCHNWAAAASSTQHSEAPHHPPAQGATATLPTCERLKLASSCSAQHITPSASAGGSPRSCRQAFSPAAETAPCGGRTSTHKVN